MPPNPRISGGYTNSDYEDFDMAIPGIIIREDDRSETRESISAPVFAILGGATRGPVGIPTLCRNENELYATFGAPLDSDYGLLTAFRISREGSQIVYVRTASNAAAAANRLIPGTVSGTAAVRATATITFSGGNNPADGDYVSIRTQIPTATLENETAGVAGNVTVTVPTGSARIAVSGMSGGAPGVRATGTIRFTTAAGPSDGDRITISDGSADGTDPVTFEFDSNTTVNQTDTLRQVVIAPNDPYGTMQNLIQAINNAPSFAVSAVSGNSGSDRVAVFEFDSNGSRAINGSILVAIGVNGATTKNNLLAAIAASGLGVTAADTTVTDPVVTITNASSGAFGNGVLIKVGSNIAVTGFTGGADPIGGAGGNILLVSASHPGSYGNGIDIVATATSTVGAPVGNFDLAVKAVEDATTGIKSTVEVFRNLSSDSASVRYAERVINDGVEGENIPSRYVRVTVISASGTITAGTYSLGSGGGTVGAVGVTTAPTDIVGTVSGSTRTGLTRLYDQNTVYFNTLLIPTALTHRDVITEVLGVGGLAESRQDFVYLVDPPFGLTAIQTRDWINGLQPGGVLGAPTTAVDSSYGALYASWARVYEPVLKKNIWLPPSANVAKRIATAPRPWTAVAGQNYGLLTDVERLEWSPDDATRSLISDTQTGQRVNPFVSRINLGITIEGNRTLHRKDSALARMHVRRGMNYLKRAFFLTALEFQWEPITDATYSIAESKLRPYFEACRDEGGLEDFRIIIDETINTPETKASDTLVVRVLLKWNAVAEIIDGTFSLYRQGASLNLN